MSVLITGTADLDRAAIVAVAGGAPIELAEAVRDAVEARRAEVLAALTDGRAVYGVNTGLGAQSGVAVVQGQPNLLLARAVGGPPWLSARQSRALIAVRLRSFLNGDAGVSLTLVEGLQSLLDKGVVPAVPRSGYGSAGEIIALAHAFGPLTGVGSVLVDGEAVDASSVGIEPVELGPKEAIALLQGVPGTTALAIILIERARVFVERSTQALAMGLLAIGAPMDPYHPELARGDDELASVVAGLLPLLEPERVPRSLQAPVSFRVSAVVLAHLVRMIAALEAAVDRALVAVTDSPAFVDGRFLGTAGFHGLDLAAHLDALSVALVHASEVSAARMHRLLDTRFSGLPAQLTREPGPQTGLIAVHKRAAGVVHQLRRTAMSSVVGSIETSFGQEDVQSFSWEAAANAQDAVEGAFEVLACEFLVGAQALTLSGVDSRLGEPVWSLVPPIEGDRVFGPDIEALRAWLAQLAR